MNTPGALTRKEAAALLQLDYDGVRGLERQGLLHPLPSSDRTIRYAETEVRALAKNSSKPIPTRPLTVAQPRAERPQNVSDSNRNEEAREVFSALARGDTPTEIVEQFGVSPDRVRKLVLEREQLLAMDRPKSEEAAAIVTHADLIALHGDLRDQILGLANCLIPKIQRLESFVSDLRTPLVCKRCGILGPPVLRTCGSCGCPER